PALACAPREHFQIRPRRAGLYDFILLIGLARMLALARRQKIHLASAGWQRTCILATDTEQDQFRHIAEVEADPTPIWPAILTNLMPDEIGFVREPPRAQNLQAFRKKRVGNPKIKMGGRCTDIGDRKLTDLANRH